MHSLNSNKNLLLVYLNEKQTLNERVWGVNEAGWVVVGEFGPFLEERNYPKRRLNFLFGWRNGLETEAAVVKSIPASRSVLGRSSSRGIHHLSAEEA